MKRENYFNLWEQVKQLNLDAGLQQSTLDDIENAIQKRINDLTSPSTGNKTE